MNLSTNSLSNEQLKIITFKDDYKEHFANLNLEWLEEYFVVEELDRKQLYNPQSIIEQGGEIFFVIEQPNVVGTCALINHGSGIYEIAKMAVTKSARSRGFGKLLMEVAIECARQK